MEVKHLRLIRSQFKIIVSSDEHCKYEMYIYDKKWILYSKRRCFEDILKDYHHYLKNNKNTSLIQHKRSNEYILP